MPKVDLREYSDEELYKVVDAGEKKAGYLAWQNAVSLLMARDTPKPNTADSDAFVINLSDDEVNKVNSVLAKKS